MFKRSVTAACKMSQALLLEQTAIRIKSKDRGSFPVVLIQYQSSMQSECRNLKPPKEPPHPYVTGFHSVGFSRPELHLGYFQYNGYGTSCMFECIRLEVLYGWTALHLLICLIPSRHTTAYRKSLTGACSLQPSVWNANICMRLQVSLMYGTSSRGDTSRGDTTEGLGVTDRDQHHGGTGSLGRSPSSHPAVDPLDPFIHRVAWGTHGSLWITFKGL